MSKFDNERVYNIELFHPLKKENFANNNDQNITQAIKEVIKCQPEKNEMIDSITDLISQITNKDLLLNTVKTLFNYISFSQIIKDIDNRIKLQKLNYSKRQYQRILSIIISKYIRHHHLLSFNYDTKVVQGFNFSLIGELITFEDSYSCIEAFKIDFALNANKKLKSIDEFNKAINELKSYDLINGNKKNKRLIKLLKNSKKTFINQSIENKEGHEDIFRENGLQYFQLWNKSCKDEPYKKFSFIFQKLKKMKKLRKEDFKSTLSYLLTSDYISKEDYKVIDTKGYWITPTNILTQKREDYFNFISTNIN